MQTANDKLIEQFEKDFELMSEVWSPLHDLHRYDIKFTWFNEQWSPEAKEDRAGVDGPNGCPPRPCNVFNILKPYIIKVCNGIKKLQMGIKVMPMDSGEDKDTAEVFRGIQRAIEINTGAVNCRDKATNDAVTAGYGFYAFRTDYEDPRSRNQELKYRFIHDATQVLWDDDDDTLDGSGCKKVVYREQISKKEFKQMTGREWEDFYQGGGPADTHLAWGNAEKPMLTEYWYVEEKKERLVRFEGQDMFLSEVEELLKNELDMSGMPVEAYLERDENGEILERETHSRKVYCCKMAGKQVISKDLWPGYWIPWFKIEGRLNKCNGDIIRQGLSRDGQPSQECYNYARNSAIERLGLSTKLSWITAEGSIPDAERPKWATSNTRNWSNLFYEAYDEKDQPLPAPFRSPAADIDVGHVQEAQTSQGEIMSVMGLYGAYTGDTSNERSGRAIMAGAQESADIVHDFADNKKATMLHEGRVRNELIPKIYDVPRQVRMVGDDDKEKVIMVNQRALDEKGNEYYYDLKRGKYDLKIEMGPSDEDRRMETVEGMKAMRQMIPPEAFMAMSDIYVKAQAFRGSDEAYERLNRWIKINMPGIIKEEGEPPIEVVQLQQQMQQMQQEFQQAFGQLQQENQQLKARTQIEMAKLEEQKQVNEEQNEVDIYNAETNRMKAETDRKDKLGKNALATVKTMTDISRPERGQSLGPRLG